MSKFLINYMHADLADLEVAVVGVGIDPLVHFVVDFPPKEKDY